MYFFCTRVHRFWIEVINWLSLNTIQIPFDIKTILFGHFCEKSDSKVNYLILWIKNFIWTNKFINQQLYLDPVGVNEEVGSQATSRIQGSVQVERNRLHRCRICSNKNILGYKTKEIRHEHFSSKYFMEREMSKSEKTGSIFCPTCKKPHSDFDKQRVKICISSS